MRSRQARGRVIGSKPVISKKAREIKHQNLIMIKRTNEPESSYYLQWIGEAGLRVRVATKTDVRTIYVDADLRNAMMPPRLSRKFNDDIVPEDASLVLLTHNNYKSLVGGVGLALASSAEDCRIVCPPDVAATLKQSNMLPSSKVLVPMLGCSIDFGFVKLTMVHQKQKLHSSNQTISNSSLSQGAASHGSCSSLSSASSGFSGMDSTGWIIKLGD